MLLSEELKTYQLTAKFENIESINPLFSKCKVKVLYTGDNRNNSSFTKESVEKAIPTLFNIPIVGEFVEQAEDFGGHGGKIEITDSEIKYVQTTKPYGVVPESAEVFWEEITENGETHEYLVVDGCYLWTGRYEEAHSVIENGKGQSMEIEINSGKFNENNVYEIADFTFSALCILGDDVEPCFEDADIVASFNLNKEDFKKQFNQMLKELKFSMEKVSKGGMEVSDKKEEFKLTAQQLTQELDSQLRKSFKEDDWGWKVYDYFYVDHDENTVFAQSRIDDWRIVGFSYTVDGDIPTVDFESKTIYKIEFAPMEGTESNDFTFIPKEEMEYSVSVKEKELEKQFTEEKDQAVNEAVGKVQVELDGLQEDYAKLEDETRELRKFKLDQENEKREQEESALFEKFVKVLSEEDISDLKEKSKEFSLEELETQLYILVGKKKANFSAQPQKKKSDMVKIEVKEEIEEVDDKPYGHLFTQYK